jgi:hypothetical protein
VVGARVDVRATFLVVDCLTMIEETGEVTTAVESVLGTTATDVGLIVDTVELRDETR